MTNRQIKEFVSKQKGLFTARDIKIILLICREYSSAEIAAKLGINTRTIETTRAKILKKTKSKTAVGVV